MEVKKVLVEQSKGRFLKQHDQNEEYQVRVTVSALKVSAQCPLLKKCENVLLRIDRGSTR